MGKSLDLKILDWGFNFEEKAIQQVLDHPDLLSNNKVNS